MKGGLPTKKHGSPIFDWADGQSYKRTFYPLKIDNFAWIVSRSLEGFETQDH